MKSGCRASGRWIFLWAFVAPGLALDAGHAVRAQTLDEARDLHRQGLLDEALAAYRQVAEVIEPTDPAGAAIARNNACVVLLGLGEPDAAVEQCRRALDLRRHAGDDRRLARTLNNFGLALQYTGRFEESRSSFLEALEINEVRDDFEAQAVNLANLGLVDTSAGRYERALRYYDQVNRLAAEHRDEPWAEEQIWTARINRGVVLERLGAFDEALSLYRDLIDGADRPEPGRRAALLANRGVVLRNLGDPVSALEDFDAAVQLYRSVGDRAGLSNALLNRGLVLHLHLGDLQSAEKSFRADLELASAGGDRLEEIQDLFFLGRLLLDLGRLDEAEEAFHRCQRIADESGVAEGRWPALEGLGRVQRARGALEAALGHFREALDVIEIQRELLSSPGRRSGYFGDKRPVYEATVEALAELHASDPGREWAAEAFAVVQRAKARELLDVVGPGQIAARPLGADAVRGLLGSDLLLEYFVAETRLYLWVVWEGGLELSDLGSSEAILDEVAELEQALSRSLELDPHVVENLSKVLLRGSEIAREKDSVTRIAPDGRLHLLPFEILRPAGAGNKRLVELGAVGYLPSGSVLATLDRPAREASYALVGFGAPTGSREVRDRRFRIEPLPGAERELPWPRPSRRVPALCTSRHTRWLQRLRAEERRWCWRPRRMTTGCCFRTKSPGWIFPWP